MFSEANWSVIRWQNIILSIFSSFPVEDIFHLNETKVKNNFNWKRKKNGHIVSISRKINLNNLSHRTLEEFCGTFTLNSGYFPKSPFFSPVRIIGGPIPEDLVGVTSPNIEGPPSQHEGVPLHKLGLHLSRSREIVVGYNCTVCHILFLFIRICLAKTKYKINNNSNYNSSPHFYFYPLNFSKSKTVARSGH
jgi:hypothetical protein